MKKKTRDLKKHYRNIERNIRQFDIDLSEESRYDMWHTHLDWYGITDVSQKHKKIHILYYIKLLEKIEKLTIESKRKFQTWLFIGGNKGWYDAIYFHTENPQSDFPYKLEIINWDAEIPYILTELLDLSKFSVGRIKDKDGCIYIIQKKGLGIEISY